MWMVTFRTPDLIHEEGKIINAYFRPCLKNSFFWGLRISGAFCFCHNKRMSQTPCYVVYSCWLSLEETEAWNVDYIGNQASHCDPTARGLWNTANNFNWEKRVSHFKNVGGHGKRQESRPYWFDFLKLLSLVSNTFTATNITNHLQRCSCIP